MTAHCNPVGFAMRNSLLPRFAALLLGGASVFGFAPFYLFPLPILVLAGLFFYLREAPPREAGLRAWLFGLGWFGAGVSWVYVSMHEVGGLPALAAAALALGFAGVLALFFGLAGWLAARLPVSSTWRVAWLLPVFWALAEWLRSWVLTGFPWQALGYSQAPYGPLAGYAPILGVHGVTLLAAFTAGALAAWRLLPLAGAAALWTAGLVLSGHAWTQPTGAPVSVSLVQGNVAQTVKFEPEVLWSTLEAYRAAVMDSDSRLIVLPETAWPLLYQDVPADYLAELRAHVARFQGHLLVGVPERDPGERYYNSLFAFGAEDTQRYRKVHLVPFGEFVPPGFRWFVDAMAIPLSDFSRGSAGQAPIVAAGQRLAVNICYEDVFGEELLHALPEATLMVNISNDAWFGDSFAPWQHHQIAQMRALEAGRWWLKANNTGLTAIIDAQGHTVASLTPFTADTLHGEAQGMTGATPYSQWGNAVFLILAFAALVWILALSRVAAHRSPREGGAG